MSLLFPFSAQESLSEICFFFISHNILEPTRGSVNLFLAFKRQFAPKCKRWHHGIGKFKWGKTTKKARKVTT
jgi:hypothetical protein